MLREADDVYLASTLVPSWEADIAKRAANRENLIRYSIKFFTEKEKRKKTGSDRVRCTQCIRGTIGSEEKINMSKMRAKATKGQRHYLSP